MSATSDPHGTPESPQPRSAQPGSAHAPASPPPPAQGATPVGSIVMLGIGILLVLLGIGPVIAGATITAVAAQQDRAGFLSTPSVPVATDSFALISPDITVTGDIPQIPFDFGTVRLTAESAGRGDDLFLGIASSGDVRRYLDNVNHAEVLDVDLDPLSTRVRERPGTSIPAPPEQQDFWIDSDSGSQVELQRRLESGDVTIVVMNADGSPGVRAELAAGIRSDLFAPAGLTILLLGILFIVVGIPLIVFGARGIGGRVATAPAASWSGDYPAVLTGELRDEPSRWLWLVKWLLAIPHYVVLALLWVAFAVVSIVAWFAILFTGRYPRALFDFNVGVLRWNWRVAFYAYSALATDKYPPFTLAATDYPADFTIEYPERLSRGLVLVKSWLLAIPHTLLIAAVTGAGMYSALSSGPWRWGMGDGDGDGFFGTGFPGAADTYWRPAGISILGILVLVVGVSLLFTARYPRAMFDLLMGLNRWGYRVAAYVGLFRDEYPPFRLDQGPGPVDRHRTTGGTPVPEHASSPGPDQQGGADRESGRAAP